MEWAKDYLKRCLVGIPKGKYRERLWAEVENHLAMLADDFQKMGYSTAEAQQEAMRQMGNAAKLNESYRAEWLQQPEKIRKDFACMLYGCIIAGVCYMIAYLVLSVVLSIILELHGDSNMLTIFRPICYTVLFLSTAIPNLVFLRCVFEWRDTQKNPIICGLILAWVLGFLGAVLVALFTHGSLPYSPTCIIRDIVTGKMPSYENTQASIWIDSPYTILTFCGNTLLGFIFQGKRGCHLWQRQIGKH